MGVDMTKWQEIAKENIHNRPAGLGRLAGKITIVTGAAQGFARELPRSCTKRARPSHFEERICAPDFH